tara:strand:- start:273 stop:617 length:345 start_codon:yes stop_codon:yes gene_type:complete
MRDMTTKDEYEPILIDDGTLDTVVSVNGVEYRYNWEPDPDIDETYDDFVAWAMRDAVEMHGELHREERGNINPKRALNWVHHALQEAINGSADEEMLKQALEIVEDLREMEVSA